MIFLFDIKEIKGKNNQLGGLFPEEDITSTLGIPKSP